MTRQEKVTVLRAKVDRCIEQANKARDKETWRECIRQATEYQRQMRKATQSIR